MTFVQDSTYKAIEELLMLHNGSVRDIAQVIMSYWFIKFPECLRNELDLHYPEFQLEMEVGLKTNHVDWDHLESKEVKLSVGLFLCNSLGSDTSIVAMIILKKLFTAKINLSRPWKYFLSDGLLYIYDLKTEVMELQNFESSDFFDASNEHDLQWLQQCHLKSQYIQFFGGRVNVGNKNHIQFLLPYFNFDEENLGEKEWKYDEEIGFEVLQPWDRLDTFTIEDSWWFFSKGEQIF